MKKKEIIFIIVIAIAAIVGYGVYRMTMPDDIQYGQVFHQDKLIMEFDINEDFTYQIQGSYGKMYIEVKDGKWRVTNEECPNHVCSSIGWVSVDNYFPIVCLPNEVYITVKE